MVPNDERSNMTHEQEADLGQGLVDAMREQVDKVIENVPLSDAEREEWTRLLVHTSCHALETVVGPLREAASMVTATSERLGDSDYERGVSKGLESGSEMILMMSETLRGVALEARRRIG